MREICARLHDGSDSQGGTQVVLVNLRSLRFANSPRLSGENVEHTRRLAEIGDPLPPIIVHRQSMRVLDGLHRVRAAQLRGQQTINASFFSGDDAAAFLLAVEANVTHGLPLSLPERKLAAARLVDSFPDRSDRSIATSTGLSDKTVAAVRSSAETPRLDTRIGQDGRSRPVDVARRRILAARLLKSQPDASLRDIAKKAHISPATVLDVRRRLARGEDPVPPGFTRGDSASPNRSSRRLAQQDPRVVLESLIMDPQLISSEAGRELLRWLYSHAIRQAECDTLIETTPSHCTEIIAGLAQSYGETWQAFAKQLADRQGRPGAIYTLQ